MADFRLETDRLVLRDWRDEDWAPFFRHTNTPAVMRHLGPLLDDAAQAKMSARIEGYAKEYGHTFWVLERKQDAAILGFCGLRICDLEGAPVGELEIGWRLREDCWGQGYAREAALATRNLAFERFDAPLLIALTVQSNRPSWGLMKRIGMRRREDLDYRDPKYDIDGGNIIVYSLDRPGWEPLPNAA